MTDVTPPVGGTTQPGVPKSTTGNAEGGRGDGFGPGGNAHSGAAGSSTGGDIDNDTEGNITNAASSKAYYFQCLATTYDVFSLKIRRPPADNRFLGAQEEGMLAAGGSANVLTIRTQLEEMPTQVGLGTPAEETSTMMLGLAQSTIPAAEVRSLHFRVCQGR